MKKIYIAMAVLATVALTSCEQEQSFDDFTPLGENDIAFYIPGPNSTRAEVVNEGTESGQRIEVGTDDNGHSLFLVESIEYLNPKTVTRGAPAYTENVGKLYKTMGVYTDSNDSGDATFNVMDETMTDNPAGGKGWRYNHQYVSDDKFKPWVDNSTAADFYLRMPASQSGVSGYEYDGGTIAFDYDASNLQNGAGLQDILFAYTSISKSKHDTYLPKGAPVMMYHALTGVKFRVGNDNTGTTKTIIRSVEISGLMDNGHCVITPSGDGTVVWTTGENPKVGSFKLDYDDYDYHSGTGDDNSIDYVKPTEGDAPFGESWYKGKTGVNNDTHTVADNNLNKEDGSLTFWFIPQEMTEDVTLKVTFCVKTPDTDGAQGGGMITHTINFGEQLAAKNVVWNAGELRTYTLEPEDVDVEIFDTMTGKSKTQLHVTNTGNVSEYVRMLVIGNWYGWETQEDYAAYESSETGKPEPEILVGYKYYGPDDPNYIADLAKDPKTDVDAMADPWFRETPKYGQYFDNTFTNGVPQNGNKWLRGNTGFYYPDPIGPGTTMNANTEALFKSYIWPQEEDFPTIYVPDPNSNVRRAAVGVHLIMEVSVQAISNKKPDGTLYDNCWDAWTAAIYPNGDGTIGPK